MQIHSEDFGPSCGRRRGFNTGLHDNAAKSALLLGSFALLCHLHTHRHTPAPAYSAAVCVCLPVIP